MRNFLLLLISVATVPLAFSATISEPAGGFTFIAPDEWERITNKRKPVKPSVTFDTMFSRQPKRIMVPAGWEDLDGASALAATVDLVRQQFQFELARTESSNFRSKEGVSITRIRYSTNSADTPTVVIYAFKLHSGVQVCFTCLAPIADHDVALREYDAAWASLRLEKPNQSLQPTAPSRRG
jgi:hypothetical protein